jgi:tRNA G18 (ribose-2'-O)-methylase SpoU
VPARPGSSFPRTAPHASRPRSAARRRARWSPDLWAYAADSEGTIALWEADLAGGVAVVLGAEGKGVRPLVRRTCDGTIAIPLAGKVASLNVSVAAALLLFEARRQRTA